MNDKKIVFLSTSHEMLEHLKAEFEDFKKNPNSTRHAINFVLTAYHLMEWVWRANLKTQSSLRLKISNKITNEASFYAFVKSSCVEMISIRSLANSSKHFYVRGIETSSSFTWDSGDIKWDEADFEWDYSGILIKIKGNQWVSALELFQNAHDWWVNFFETHLKRW